MASVHGIHPIVHSCPIDLAAHLRPQIDRRDEFDQIVIETTGLANPHSIIRTFNMIQEVWDHMALDAVVTLVDAKHIERQLDEPRPAGVDNEALKQIAYADRIVLNKVDLVCRTPLSLGWPPPFAIYKHVMVNLLCWSDKIEV